MRGTARRSASLRRAALTLGAIGLLGGCAAPAPAPPAVAPAPPTATVPSTSEAPIEQRFAQWIAAFRASARAAGIDDATLAAAFDDVQYLPAVVERDRAQPEFVRPVWDYLDAAVSARRVAQGRARLAEVQTQADATSARYGVPATILVAIWGVESNYGSRIGDISTIDALATLAFDGRREAWARAELLAALRILQRGDIDRARMIGSWAGAMGQTQLLPSSYLAYAVDAEGNGRRDIWGSIPDVLASTANLLAHAGWRAGEPWGTEVQLPAGFDLARADASIRQPSTQWATEGVRAIDGQPLPPLADAALFLPAGARGPAFLVGTNFRALMRYNASASYALAVGLLAQRIAGGAGVVAAWPREQMPLSRGQIEALQSALNAQGCDAGAADGLLGPKTRAALRCWQRSIGLPADGWPTLELLERLQGR